MHTLFDPRARSQVFERIDRLKPQQRPIWGRMTSGEMLCHTADQLRNALGDLEAKPVGGPLAHAPINWLVIHVIPWPKGKAQSPPEFLARRPATWEQDTSALKELIRRFAARGSEAEWPASPVFGRISGKAWGVLAYKHLDHHLRQFGA